MTSATSFTQAFTYSRPTAIPVPMRSLGSATIMFGSSAATALISSRYRHTPSWQAPPVGPGYRTGDLGQGKLALGGSASPRRHRYPAPASASIVPFRPGRIGSICWAKTCILSEVFLAISRRSVVCGSRIMSMSFVCQTVNLFARASSSSPKYTPLDRTQKQSISYNSYTCHSPCLLLRCSPTALPGWISLNSPGKTGFDYQGREGRRAARPAP